MLKAAVIGLGYWGPNLLRNFNRHPSSEVKYICDIDGKRVKEISRLYPDAKAVSDYRKLLDADIELVAISTSWRTHYGIAGDFLKAGKHILVEKPFTGTVKEAERLLGLASKKGLRIFVNHTYLFHPVLGKIKNLIDSGKSGEIFYFHSERVSPLMRDDISAVWDLAPHDLSMILFLFGKPATIEVRAARCLHGRHVDYAHIITGWESGLAGHIHVNRLSPFKVRKVTLGSNRRTIWWDDMAPDYKLSYTESRMRRVHCGNPPVNQIMIKGDMRRIITENTEPLYLLVDNIVSRLKDWGASAVDGEHGLEVVRMLAACDESIKKGGKKIRL